MRSSRLLCRRFFLLSICIFTLSMYMFYQALSMEAVTCFDKMISPNTGKPEVEVISERNITRHTEGYRRFVDSKLISVSRDDLEHNRILNTVHYVWCHNYTLRFENYLSILNAWKVMQPDIIELHTKDEIPKEEDKYNFWLEELKKTIPGFVVKVIPSSDTCGVWYGIDVLLDRGGIYFHENLFLIQSLRKLRREDFAVSFTNTDYKVGYIMSKDHDRRNLVELKQFLHRKRTEDPAEILQQLPSGATLCEVLGKDLAILNNNTTCVEMPSLYPKDIMYSNSSFGYHARLILYGDSAIVSPNSHLPGLIPKIIHYVWFNKKSMDFMMYLSLRSTLTILKPEKVYIHGDNALEGDYIEKFKKDPRVVMVYRERPRYIFGRDVLYTQHKSDIIRADVLLKYGGIYMDWDVIWLRPVDDLIQKGYDAILNFDHMPWPHYPDAFNLGVLMAKPRSEFIQQWQAALVDYRSRDFFYNALLLPYKIYERFPRSVHIEKHLQVMCYQLKCHPTFQSGYKNYQIQQDFNWQKDTYSIHFTFPDPQELTSKLNLTKGRGMFADIGRFILHHPYEFD